MAETVPVNVLPATPTDRLLTANSEVSLFDQDLTHLLRFNYTLDFSLLG